MCFLLVMDQGRAWCYMILESIVDCFLRWLAMTEYAAINMKTVICDAYTDLVAGDSPVLLAVASFLHILLDHLQICLIKIYIAGEHYLILSAFKRQKYLSYPVSCCIVCLSVSLGDCLEALLREQLKAGIYPFAYRLLMVLEKCSCKDCECPSAIKAAVSPQASTQIAISLVSSFLAVWAGRWLKCVEQLAFLRIRYPWMPAAVFFCRMVVEKRLKRRH